MIPEGSPLINSDSEIIAATEYDQFGNALATQPAFSWSVSGPDGAAAIGTINSSTGTYTAAAAGGGGTGTDIVTASAAGVVSAGSLVETGPFVGTVYGDGNGDSSQDDGEQGLSGLEVYLDTGDGLGPWPQVPSGSILDY